MIIIDKNYGLIESLNNISYIVRFEVKKKIADVIGYNKILIQGSDSI